MSFTLSLAYVAFLYNSVGKQKETECKSVIMTDHHMDLLHVS